MPRQPKLSPQEQRVLAMIGKGYPTQRIAEKLGVSSQTARQYITHAIAFVKQRGHLEKGEEALLTPRQEQVADLLRRGIPNSEIASRLGIGQRTAESHVAHVLRKLGVSSRSQLRQAGKPPLRDGD